MVFTWPVENWHTRQPGGTDLSRRRVFRLAAGAALAGGATVLAGCGLLGDDEPAPVPPPDPLTPLLEEALRMAAAYDAAVQARPELSGRLAPLAAAHRAHATELARMVRPPASGAPATSGSAPPPAGEPGAVLSGLRKAEEAGQRTAATACRAAPAERAALLGSIAAARATHAEALR